MNIFEVLGNTLPGLLDWGNLGWIIAGIAVGMPFGILPGLGSPQALTLFLPVTFAFEPTQAVLLLLGIAGSATIGGSITSVLLGVPGTPANAATVIDGYPLTKRGKAELALGAAITSSVLGGIFGIIVLLLMLQYGYEAVLAFSYPEFFMLAVLGIILIAFTGESSTWKGLIAGGIGLLLSTFGYDPFLSFPRYSFGFLYLWNGIKIVPVLIGLFAIAESVELFVKKDSSKDLRRSIRVIRLWEGVKAVFINFRVFLLGSVVGVIIGILPGIGASLAQFMAYSLAVQVSKDKSQFGKGDIRGVIGPESSNNAKDGGSLVPTLMFGIPGSVDTAILLGAFMMHGITPGLTMLTDRPEVVVGTIVSLTLATVISGVLAFTLARHLIKVLLIPVPVVATIVFVLSVLGVYTTDNAYGDVVVAFLFGVLGYLMKQNGFSRTSLVIGLLLGRITEMNFRQGLATMGLAGFFTRPITLALVIITILLIGLSILLQRRRAQEVAL